MSDAAFATAREHAEACFEILAWELRAWHARRRLAFTAEDDPFRLLGHVARFGPTEFGPTERASLEPAVTAAHIARETAARLRQRLQARLSASVPAVGTGALHLPLEELRAALSLTDGPIWLLTWLVLHAVSAPFAETVRAVLPRGLAHPTLGLVVEMLGLDDEESTRAFEAASGALGRLGFVQVRAGLDPGLVHGVPSTPDDVCDILLRPRKGADVDERAPIGLAKPAEDAIRQAVRQRARTDHSRVLVLLGLPGVGRRTAVRHLARSEGRPLLVAGETPGPVRRTVEDLRRTLRRALTTDGVVLFRAEAGEDSWTPEDRYELLDSLRAYGLPCVATASDSGGSLSVGDVDETTTLTMELSSTIHGGAIWADALDRHGLTSQVPPSELAARIPATPGTLHRTLDRWTAQVGGRRAAGLVLDVPTVAALVDAATNDQLATIAEPVPTTMTWDDLVVPPDLAEQLGELLNHARFGTRVFHDWGFGRMVPYGRGLAALFHGPPGTGKTMAATLLARSLERPLYRIDLSRIVDKYIGETEKNLARLFASARTSNAVLMFDEADSLFSKRTQVQSSNDRYSNLEVNFLLQKIEQFEGMALLTTNNVDLIDPAFKRRMRFRIAFPEPTPDERARMWSGFLPRTAPISADLDTSALGRRYDICGGHIKQAVLRAAFRAAAEQRPITQADLEMAATHECRELGKLVSSLRVS